MKINQILFDRYGNQLTVKSIKGKEYTGILMYRATYATGTGLTRAKAAPQEVSFTDESLGVEYFYALDHIGNRDILFDEAGPYYFNRKNIKQKYEEYMVSLKSSLPYGVWLENQEDYQDVIDSFYDMEQRQEDEQFIGFHPSCFGRLDLDSEFSVGHDVKYFDEHFHDRLYISKGRYQKIENVQIINWRAEIATLYYEKSKLTHKSLRYADVFSKEQYEGVPGVEYKYQVMLRRSYTTNPFSMQDTYICGTPRKKEVETDESIEDIQNLYKEGGVDPFLLKVLEEKRLENKLTDIIASIQSNQNAMIRHTDKLNMIVQGCAGSGKTMILLHRISYLMYNQKLRNINRAAIIVPNSKFSIFIDELSGNLDIDQIPRYTMSQYYLKLILDYQNRIYRSANSSERPIVAAIQAIEKREFVQGNATDEDELFDDSFEFDTCDFYDKWMEKFVADINEEEIIHISQRIGLEILDAQTNEKRLNRNYSLVVRCQDYIEENTRREKDELEKAQNRVNNLRIPERHVAGLRRRIKELFKEFSLGPSYSLYSLVRSLNGKAELEHELAKLREKQFELERQAKSENRGLLRFVSGNTETKEKLNKLATRIAEVESELANKEEAATEPAKLTEIRGEIDKFKRWKRVSLLSEDSQNILAEYDIIIEMLFAEDISVDIIREKLDEMIEKYQMSEDVVSAREELIGAEEAYNSALDAVVPADERSIIEKAKEKLDSRDAVIKTVFEEYRQIKFENIHNSRDLFVLLAFYLLHVGKIGIEKDFLFIDEAQDYSEIEYRLLKGLHEDRTIFELYGDSMQKVTPNRGIDDWGQVKALLGDEYYELKENYRNTVEIADYVNDNIKHVFRIIGLHGDEVCELGVNWKDKAISDINSQGVRTAIICKDKRNIKTYDLIGIEEISIYTVLEAKGLEFEVVYVLDRGMTDNERYISYSRALRNLYVIH